MAYGNSPFNDSKARMLSSNFTDVITQAIAAEITASQIHKKELPIRQDMELLNFYKTNKLENLFERHYTLTKEKLQRRKLDDNTSSLELELCDMEMTFNLLRATNKTTNQSFQNLEQYIINKNYQTLESIIVDRLSKNTYLINTGVALTLPVEAISDQFLFDFLLTTHLEKKPFLNIIKHLFLFVFSGDLAFCSKFKALMEQFGLRLDDEARRILLTACSNKLWFSNLEHGPQSFALSQEAHALNELSKNLKSLVNKNTRAINVYTFMRIVKDALTCNEVQWAKKFATTYQKYLSPFHRLSATRYVQSLILFEDKQFKRALTYIANIENNEIAPVIEIKNTLVKIYFELHDYEGLHYALINYGYSIENETRNHIKQSHQQFIDCTKELIKCKKTKAELFVMANYIIPFHRKWMREKIEAYKSL